VTRRHLRRAFQLPGADIAERWTAYHVRRDCAGTPFKALPMPSLTPAQAFTELTVVASYVEVWLAKEGHSGPVGINLLEKIQLPTLPSLYGAMLAGVDYVLMGAGIPRSIPGALDLLARGEPASLRIDIAGDAPDAPTFMNFDPRCIFAGQPPRRAPSLPRDRLSSALRQHSRESPPAPSTICRRGLDGGRTHRAPRGTMLLA
jgi:NAD(P)H-dependent flavin oxidoreductase YrpB (nitropropane dioxygenase family)